MGGRQHTMPEVKINEKDKCHVFQEKGQVAGWGVECIELCGAGRVVA